MKKILAILLAAVLMLGLLSACGEKTETKPETAAETTAAPAAEAEKAEEKSEAAPEAEAKPETAAPEAEAEKPADAAAGSATADGLIVSVVSATVTPDVGSVTVPVKIDGNTGLAGVLISVSYDKALTLTGAKVGTALKSLTFTPGGDLTANPFNLLWDGQEADATNGDIAYLTFIAPKTPGDYAITLTADAENVYDNDLKNVPVTFANGTVTVNEKG